MQAKTIATLYRIWYRIRLTLPRFLPYYLISNLCPIPDHASGFAQELWISNTPEAKDNKKPSASLIYLYQITHFFVKKIFPQIMIFFSVKS
jgi:hypothetical protein